MTNDECLKNYIRQFNYKEDNSIKKNKKVFFKASGDGLICIESYNDSKYVNFYFKEKVKTFKKSDLLICAIEKIPAGWEAENE